MAISSEIKESLKRLADIRVKSQKEVKAKLAAESPDDIYTYEAGNPEFTHKEYFVYHGKCFDAASTELINKYKYVFTKTGHLLKSDPKVSGAMCQHCKKRLDDKTYQKRLAEQSAKTAQHTKAYNAWVKKQLMLGKDVTCKCEKKGKVCPNAGRSLSD